MLDFTPKISVGLADQHYIENFLGFRYHFFVTNFPIQRQKTFRAINHYCLHPHNSRVCQNQHLLRIKACSVSIRSEDRFETANLN